MMRPIIWTLSLLLLIPSVGLSQDFGVAQKPVLPGKSILEKPVQPELQLEEKDAGFREELTKAIREARKDGVISFRDALKLRLATLSPAFVERAQELAVTQMVFSGEEAAESLPYDEQGRIEVSRIDWEKFGEFLKVLVPLLIQILQIFGV